MIIEEIYKKAENTEIIGTTVNECLYISGLIDVFDKVIKTNKVKSRKILVALKVDDHSIDKIIGK